MARITLNDIAGYATERTVWQVMQFVTTQMGDNGYAPHPEAIEVTKDGFAFTHDVKANGKANAFAAPESNATPEATEKACVWSLGALAFYLLTGTHVFEGRGGCTQSEETLIPLVSSSLCGDTLREGIKRCLNFSPKNRPSVDELRAMAADALKKTPKPKERPTNDAGKSYRASLVKFWPEEMAVLITFALILLHPLRSSAQTTLEVDTEMKNLAQRCIDLRSSANKEKVAFRLKKDTNWTLMDEIEIDTNGECTTNDDVNTLGLNTLAYKIILDKEGVTNTGGRFRNGQDERYNYSFIEITVKKGASVNYDITGREGKQLIAIVPYDATGDFDAYVTMDGQKIDKKENVNEVRYIHLDKKVKKEDVFKLTIKNKATRNASFVIINYNSRK